MVMKGKAHKSGVALNKEKPNKVRAGKQTLEMCCGAGGLNRDGGWKEKAEEHDGASGACARSPVATAYGHRPANF
eukprot:4253147-Pleurochrysis_carterae.AAC.1